MVDRARVTAQADELAAALSDLVRYRAGVQPGDLERDRDRRNMVLHALLVAIQSAIDLAHRLIAERRLRRPDTYREAFEILDHAGLVSSDLAERLADLSGFRNVLVHVYFHLDLARAYAILQDDSRALEEFAGVVRDLLE